ncbi:MAG: hypothetical protein SGI90_07520 [Candidatus Eisenbacteria bacterium]|nr:hypothetical protein [Candidatus Eisenbacteria bacterium]
MRVDRLIATAIVLLGFVGCGGGTKVRNDWKDPTAVGPLGNILIIGVSDNQTSRRSFEDTFASTLTAHGNVATQSHPIIPGGHEADKVAISGMVREKGFDGILTTRAVSVGKEPVTRPGMTDYTPPNYYYSYWDFYSAAASAVSAPGYYSKETSVQVESNLYDAGGKLLWSARSPVIKHSSMNENILELSETLTTRLEKAGLIK